MVCELTLLLRGFCVLNPHVFDDKGKVIANARKGKLIALIESDLYTASNFVRRLRLGLAVDSNLYEELNAPRGRRSDLPNFINAFLKFMGQCAQHAFEYKAVVIGIQFPDKNGGYKDYFLQWAEHCLNTIVDRCGNRIFNAKAFVAGGDEGRDKGVDKGGSMERTHLSQEIEAKERLAHLAYMWSNFAFNATDEVQETFTLPEVPWEY